MTWCVRWLSHLAYLLRLLGLLSMLGAAEASGAAPLLQQPAAERISATGSASATGPRQVSQAVSHQVYLAVSLNGQATNSVAPFTEIDGHLSADPKDLNELGITGFAGVTSTAAIPLDSIPGLTYRYDQSQQTVDLKLSDAARKPFTLNTRGVAKVPQSTSSRGFLINYDAYAQTNTAARLAIFSEQRFFDRFGVVSNDGIAYLYRGDNRYMREDTYWAKSDPASLTTMQVGDAISSALTWSRAVRIGGFQWRSNFALRPDLVTFPVPSLFGSAAVPTSVDLYINSVRQFSGNLPSGPFVINDVPGITGGGNATVLTTDALGRTVATSVPLYVDARLLAAGLSSYSVEAGFLREQYGLESFDYNPRPAASASVRRGLSDNLTVEGHAEATSGLYNAGVGALWRLGTLGVFNGSLSASAGVLSGGQISLGYQWIEPSISIDAQTIRATGRYGDLAARDGTPAATATDRVTVSVPVLHAQTVSVSYIGSAYPGTHNSHIGSVSYSRVLGNLMSLNLSAFQDFAQAQTRGVFVSLSIGLGGNVSVNTSVGNQNGKNTYAVDAVKPPDYGGGFGWAAQAGSSGAVKYGEAQAQYLGRDGELTATAQNVGGTTTGSLDLSGALVLMDGSVQPTRRIYDGFALVSTDGAGGIPVLHENRLIGVTDRSGYLLVPDLNSYQNNRVAIDGMKLPADTSIATTSIDVVPQAQSGVLAHFGVSHYAAASVILRAPDGKLVPPGSRVHNLDNGQDTIVGFDGITFVDGLHAQNRLSIDSGTLHCSVTFAYQRPNNGSLPTIGPLECR